MFQKKSHPIKIKINYHAQALKNQKKKRDNVNAQGKNIKKKGWVMVSPPPPKKKRPKEGQRCYPGKRDERKKKYNLN